MKIVVAGASGFLGRALVPALVAQGHEVVRLVRRTAGSGEVEWDPEAGRLDPAALAGVEAGICLSDAGVGDHRWTAGYRETILRSRTATTGLLASTLATLDPLPRVFLAASAIGIYGDRGDEPLDESSPRGEGFLADVVQEWEAAAEPAAGAGIRVCHLRTGLVQDPNGGALARQLPLFRFGLGGPMGNGRQWQSWITLDDEIRAIVFLLTAEGVSGPVNVTAPQPVRQLELARALARAMHRPAVLPTPAFALKIVLGAFAGDVLASQRVLPRALEGAGFTWTSPEAATAFATMLGAPSIAPPVG